MQSINRSKVLLLMRSPVWQLLNRKCVSSAWHVNFFFAVGVFQGTAEMPSRWLAFTVNFNFFSFTWHCGLRAETWTPKMERQELRNLQQQSPPPAPASSSVVSADTIRKSDVESYVTDKEDIKTLQLTAWQVKTLLSFLILLQNSSGPTINRSINQSINQWNRYVIHSVCV